MSSENPFQAPTPIEPLAEPVDSALNAAEEKKFNQQIIALGAFWIIIGAITLGFVGVAFSNGQRLPLSVGGLVFVGVLGLLWIGIGVLTCMKKIPAVWVGLILSYLSLLGQVISVNLCGLVILVLVITQAHRVISWSKKR